MINQTRSTTPQRYEQLALYRDLQRQFRAGRRATVSRERLIALRARDRRWYWLAL